MRQLLLLVVIHNLVSPVRSIHDLIWNKQMEKFESIASRPNFAVLYENDSRAKHTYNFQGKAIRLAYYDMPNIITGEENGTSVTGYIGEIWKTLAEYLNFTLKPILTNDKSVGWQMDNETLFSPGLLRMLQLNQTDVVARIEGGFNRRSIAQFSHPLRRTRRVAGTTFKREGDLTDIRVLDTFVKPSTIRRDFNYSVTSIALWIE
ncbi:uncharacterized protein LOC143260473 [Megalopta genalis]|uniref:uncharacterized protein LOC143260473 n=1 Tax=Megalopta genalis TaxID=115081 RepID=UPI003FD66CB9